MFKYYKKSKIFFSDPSVIGGTLAGHTDAVWGIIYHQQRHQLLSCSADSTVRFWSANEPRTPLLSTYAVEKGMWSCNSYRFIDF